MPSKPKAKVRIVMKPAHESGDEPARPQRSHREIGPLGTASRIVGGTAAVLAPLAIWGSSWCDWAAGLVGFPALAGATGGVVTTIETRVGMLGRAGSRGMGWPAALVLLAVVLGGATAVTFVTPIDGTAVWIFLGVSMLLAAFKGYGGCEVLAFANAATGRRDRVGCVVFAPVDWAEARRDWPPGERAR